jgi:glycosyltransferase involved in cell wall biosynthesis
VERGQYPTHFVAEVRCLQVSILLSAALGRLIAFSFRLIGVASRIMQKVFGLLSVTVSKGCSLAIRLNQHATQLALLGFRRLGLLPHHESVLMDSVVFYDPDVLHAHDLPRLRVATKAKKRLGVPLIYDAHELYPEIATQTLAQKKILNRREKRCIKYADAVITVNEFIADEMAKRYRIEKPQVILNATKWPENLRGDRR